MARTETERSRAFVSSLRTKQLLAGYRGEILPGSLVLDVGCGSGTMAKAVEETCGAKIEGADITNLLVQDFPFHKLPEAWETWPDRSFDIVMINDALHHMTAVIQLDTLRESLRVGKKVLIFETYPTLVAKALDLIMAYIIYHGHEVVTLTHKSPEAWCEILAGLGCRVETRSISKPSVLYPLRHFAIVAQR